MRFRVYSLSSNRERSPLARGRKSRAVNSQGAAAKHSVDVKRRLLIEPLCPRQVLADASGLVFEDTNLSWRPDSGELGQPSRIVFVDANDNGVLDENESLQLTDAAGRFDFQDLSGDESIVRLFSGSAASMPIFPVSAAAASTIPVADASSITGVRDNLAIALAGTTLQRVDIEDGAVTSIEIPGVARAAEWLPDGRILVLASDSLGNHAFTIDGDDNVTPLVLQADDPVGGWSDIAIDSSGNGVLVEQSDQDTLLRAIAVGDGIAVGNTTTVVGAGTRVFSGGELTSVISTPTDDGIRLRLWSNATGTEIGDGGIEIDGGQEVLSYDDQSGLVLLRTTADSVTLLDAAAGFAPLQTVSDVAGPVVLDASRELLFAVSPGDAVLRIIDLNTAHTLARLALDVQSIATAAQLSLDSGTGKLLVMTAAGIAPIALQRTSAHRVRHSDDATLDELLFALGPTTTENTPPEFSELPALTAAEDTALVLESPQFLATGFDAEGDQFVVLLQQQAAHGLVVVTPTGGFGYVPDANFNGLDRFSVILHDGRTASEPIELTINVAAVNDPITLTAVAATIPENASENVVAASIQTVNVDGGQVVLSVDDPRFKIVDQSVVVAAGTQFDFETEPTVSFNVTATNPTTGESAVQTVEVSIGDVDELVVDIQPDSASIDENRVGELIAEVFVVDDGEGTQYDFAVDDERFEVLFRDLRLKPGISLDYEAEPTVTIHITATSATGATKTEPVVITVRDIGEQASSIELKRNQVVELVRGATVGDILIDGNMLGSSYIATVDDTRFEIVGSELKLRTSEFVRFDDQQEIQVVLTVQDAGATFLPVSGTFVLEVLANENPFHNESNPYDVNADGQVNPLDALLIINSMSRHGGPGPIEEFPSPDRFYDVNGDGYITALDALLIINFLNRQNRGAGEQSPEPEAPDAITQDSANRRSQPAAAPLTAAPMTIGPVHAQVVVADPPLAEPTQREAKPKVTLQSDVDLAKLRDEVLVLLETDELSDADEVEAAIDDFLAD